MRSVYPKYNHQQTQYCYAGWMCSLHKVNTVKHGNMACTQLHVQFNRYSQACGGGVCLHHVAAGWQTISTYLTQDEGNSRICVQ